jgi:hypothetical protein
MRLARRAALAALATSVLLALPGLAHAAVYCVNASGCSGTNEPDLQSAFNAAMASTTETDTVQVGDPGPPPVSGYNYTDGGVSANQVHLIGAGPAQTVLTGTASGILSVLGPGSTISDLTVQLPNGNGTGIGTSGSLSNVNITSLDTGGNSQTGVILLGSGSQQWKGGTVTLPTGAGGSHVAIGRSGTGGTVDLEDLGLVAQSEGIIAGSGDNMTLRRVSVTSGVGVVGEGAHVVMDNVAFRSLGSPDIFLVSEPIGGSDASAELNHVTAYGAAVPGSPGLLVLSSSSGRSATVNIRNSVMRNFFYLVERSASSSGAVANVNASYSDIDLIHKLDTNSSGGAGAVTAGPGMIDADPLFTNPTASDFGLQARSPARDAGDPAGLQPGDSATDLAGAPRISNGRQDMGAYELQVPPPVPPPAKDTTAPSLKTSKLPKTLTLKKLLAGITFTVVPSEPSSIDATLAGSARSVKLAKNFNLTLAHRKLGLAAGKRRVTLKVRKKLLGHSRRFSLQLTLVATDAAGNKRTLRRTIKVH